MNNLFWIPGIVCQGDDGQPVSKPKQTDKNTHSVSQGRLMRLLEAERHIFFSLLRLEALKQHRYKNSYFRSDLMNL